MENDSNVTRMTSNSSESPTPTLQGSTGNHTTVPVATTDLGQALPNVKTTDGEFAEKDHHVSTADEPAAGDLGLKNGHYDEKATQTLPPPVDPTRTKSTTNVTHNADNAAGGLTVPGPGMPPNTKPTSRPPGVGMFGGAAPEGIDAEEGFWAPHSQSEEEARTAERAEKGADPWAVKFEVTDRDNPKHWTLLYRWWLTAIGSLLVLNSTFASTAPAGVITDLEKYFTFSQEAGVMTITVYVCGYMVGPLFWGPLSESYGRRPIFIISFFAYTCWQVGCALSKNTGSILVFRFLSGCFAAAPLTNSGALLADIWDLDHRGQAMSMFALAPFAGPSVGPIVAGFIDVTGTSWRWVFWILAIFAGVCLGIIVFCVPETYAPTILMHRAQRMRKETGEERWYAPLERMEHESWGERLREILFKPFIMLALEPMLLSVTIYMSFVYGVVYLLFEAYPFVFIKNHGFNTGEEGLCFLGFFFGGVLAAFVFLLLVEPRFQRHVKDMDPEPFTPEKRLEMCILSSWALVVAFFWFAWTSYPSIHWISPVLAGGLLGFAVLGMFVSLFNYIIDVYLWSAASALAATTVCRSVFGAAFPAFSNQMYDKLGTQWASSLLGFIALIMAPIPIVLYKYGPYLREKSKFAPNKATS